jgi:hypothetical protein
MCRFVSHASRGFAALDRVDVEESALRVGRKALYLRVEIIPRRKLESFHENAFRLIPELPL